MISVEGRAHSVLIHYLEQPAPDYVQAAVEAALEIHRSEGPGDVLVFLTGEEEIESAVKLLNEEATGRRRAKDARRRRRRERRRRPDSVHGAPALRRALPGGAAGGVPTGAEVHEEDRRRVERRGDVRHDRGRRLRRGLLLREDRRRITPNAGWNRFSPRRRRGRARINARGAPGACVRGSASGCARRRRSPRCRR